MVRAYPADELISPKMTKILSVAFYEWDSFLANISIALSALLPAAILGGMAASSLTNTQLVVELLVLAVVMVSVMIPLLTLINGIALRLHPDKELPG